jgi:hypothetical protein
MAEKKQKTEDVDKNSCGLPLEGGKNDFSL